MATPIFDVLKTYPLFMRVQDAYAGLPWEDKANFYDGQYPVTGIERISENEYFVWSPDKPQPRFYPKDSFLRVEFKP